VRVPFRPWNPHPQPNSKPNPNPKLAPGRPPSGYGTRTRTRTRTRTLSWQAAFRLWKALLLGDARRAALGEEQLRSL
jgi:hypothetical protein